MKTSSRGVVGDAIYDGQNVWLGRIVVLVVGVLVTDTSLLLSMIEGIVLVTMT
jgi:hypothetical protein